MMLSATRLASPVGTLTLVASDTGLVAVLWPDDDPRRVVIGAWQARDDHPILRAAAAQLAAYFAGDRRSFDVPFDMRGTDFQLAVWAALPTIPYGETRSYGALAQMLGRPGASRAVGAANGRNPLSIVVPCHRVVGSTGRLTGFAGGLEIKARLLAMERRERELPFE